LGALVRLPFVLRHFPLRDFARTAVNAVAVNSGTGFEIAANVALRISPENKFKISARFLFGDVGDAIP
jgi:hypothetical protein